MIARKVIRSGKGCVCVKHYRIAGMWFVLLRKCISDSSRPTHRIDPPEPIIHMLQPPCPKGESLPSSCGVSLAKHQSSGINPPAESRICPATPHIWSFMERSERSRSVWIENPLAHHHPDWEIKLHIDALYIAAMLSAHTHTLTLTVSRPSLIRYANKDRCFLWCGGVYDLAAFQPDGRICRSL